MSSTATPMWSILPNMRRQSMRPRREDLGHRRDADLELLGGRLLGRQVALDLPAGGVEGLGQRLAVVAVAPGEHLDRERGAAEADRRRGRRARALDQALEQRPCRRPRAASSGRSGWSRSGRALWAPWRRPRPPARRRRSPCARPRGRRRGRGRRGRPGRARRRSPGPRPRAGRRPAALRRSRLVIARVAAIAPTTRGSSKGSRAAGIRRRTSGSTAIASASLNGPRRPGTLATSFGASSGLRSEATSIAPSVPRTAAAQWVGPWIRRPLRSAIPPSRSFSSSAIDST